MRFDGLARMVEIEHRAPLVGLLIGRTIEGGNAFSRQLSVSTRENHKNRW